MNTNEIHIDEENIRFFWVLTALVSIALASYKLFNAFIAYNWSLSGYSQLFSLLLFSIGFYSIIRITSPLFRFILKISGSSLTIEFWKGDDHPLDVQTIDLKEINNLRISPHHPRSSKEALFDFSTGYYLLYHDKSVGKYKRLIDLEGQSFTLKVEDIEKIIQFLTFHDPELELPEKQVLFINNPT